MSEYIGKDTIEAEFLVCAGLCVNDFDYGQKDVLVSHCNNEEILRLLDSLCHHIRYVGDLDTNLAKKYKKEDILHGKFDLIIDLGDTKARDLLDLLKKDSVLITKLPSLESSLSIALDSIKGAPFAIKMPFKINENYYLFLSNKFHPLADICLQKIDMMESLVYYNAKIHEAAFAMPNYLRDSLKGVALN